MKVLAVCHRFPYPPADGSRVRAFHVVQHLQRRHEVTVATLVRSGEEASHAPALAERCTALITGRIAPLAAALRMAARLPTPTPSTMGFFHSPELARRIDAALGRERFDLIYVHCSSMAQYVEHATGVPKILDFVDMDSQKWLAYAGFRAFPLSLGYRIEGRKLAAAEAAMADRFDVCTTITRAEQATLESFGIRCASGWFPNGVDLERLAPSGEPYDPDALCFVGRMDYFPNQHAMSVFCREAWPRIRAARPTARLSIVGAAPPASVRALARLPGVTVTGTVPDVRPHVRAAAASLATLQIARGTQNKILESWALGVPVIASSRAAAGVDATPGRELLIADTPGATADAAIRLMSDPTERQRLSAAGRSRVERTYTWDAALAKLDAYIDLARRSRCRSIA